MNKDNRNRLIAASLAVALMLGVVWWGRSYLWPKATTPVAAKVAKKVVKPTLKERVGALEKKAVVLDERVTIVEKRVTKLENPPAPAPPAPTAPVIIPPAPAVTPSPAAKDNSLRPVMTDGRWLILGPPSQVPPPKVPVKGIEGPDIR